VQTRDTNSLSLRTANFNIISSIVWPRGGPAGMNTHAQSEQPQPSICFTQVISRAVPDYRVSSPSQARAGNETSVCTSRGVRRADHCTTGILSSLENITSSFTGNSNARQWGTRQLAVRLGSPAYPALLLARLVEPPGSEAMSRITDPTTNRGLKGPAVCPKIFMFLNLIRTFVAERLRHIAIFITCLRGMYRA
jgi:hypothetical protein